MPRGKGKGKGNYKAKGGNIPDVSTPSGMMSWAMLLFLCALVMLGFTIWLLYGKQQDKHTWMPNDSNVPVTVVVSNPDATAAMNVPRLGDVAGATRVPLNIATRGEAGSYEQIGLLTAQKVGDEDPIIMPLFGRKLYHRSDRWEYYAGADKMHVYKIPVYVNNKNCTEEVGCDEIYDGDTVTVPTYQGKIFKATIYKRGDLRYIPL